MSEIVTYQWCQRCDCFTQRETPCPKCDESDCFIELVDKDAYDQAIKERDHRLAKLCESLSWMIKTYEPDKEITDRKALLLETELFLEMNKIEGCGE